MPLKQVVQCSWHSAGCCSTVAAHPVFNMQEDLQSSPSCGSIQHQAGKLPRLFSCLERGAGEPGSVCTRAVLLLNTSKCLAFQRAETNLLWRNPAGMLACRVSLEEGRLEGGLVAVSKQLKGA